MMYQRSLESYLLDDYALVEEVQASKSVVACVREDPCDLKNQILIRKSHV